MAGKMFRAVRGANFAPAKADVSLSRCVLLLREIMPLKRATAYPEDSKIAPSDLLFISRRKLAEAAPRRWSLARFD